PWYSRASPGIGRSELVVVCWKMLPAHHGEVAQFAWWQRPDGSRVMRAISRPTQEWWTIARARQGANTPVPLERYAPASFKRSLGRCPTPDVVRSSSRETRARGILCKPHFPGCGVLL